MRVAGIKFPRSSRKPEAGYTLVEALVVVVIIGTLMAIGLPGLIAFRNRFALNTAQGKVFAVLKQTQSEAKLLKSKRQASFRMQGKQVQWAVHDVALSPSSATWYDLSSNIIIDPYNTTLYDPVPNTIWRMQFDGAGNANGQLGRITLTNAERPDRSIDSARKNNRLRRCVFISTLIGTLRVDRDKGCVVQ